MLRNIGGANSPKSLASILRVLYLRPIMLRVGRNVNIQPLVRLEGFHNISIGDNSGIGRNSHLSALSKISIGDNVMIGEDLIIKTANHTISASVEMIKLPMISKPVKIGNNVWIGARVIILSGVSIGDNVVVAAGAVVTKSFPSNCVIGGVPARIIKYIE